MVYFVCCGFVLALLSWYSLVTLLVYLSWCGVGWDGCNYAKHLIFFNVIVNCELMAAVSEHLCGLMPHFHFCLY